jgi:KaiC/GvpD/RAD55 family RecA-like ATPase
MGVPARLSTGVPGLDDRLGGGLVPGTLTVVVGASGIGKTQLGMQFANAGLTQEKRRGILFDMNARIDAQSHADYAQRMFDWRPSIADTQHKLSLDNFFAANRQHGEYLHIFDHSGRRVTQRQAGFDAWHDWQAEISTKLAHTIAFFYGNFTQGTRRAVVDGIEPADQQSESIQFELFEYIYHQILRKEAEWVARDLFREHFRENANLIAQHSYDHGEVGCMMLYTCHEAMLDTLIERPLQDGDLFAGANTLIYLGKIREGTKLRRALYIAKHRGSACSEEIAMYTINDVGLSLVDDR